MTDSILMKNIIIFSVIAALVISAVVYSNNRKSKVEGVSTNSQSSILTNPDASPTATDSTQISPTINPPTPTLTPKMENQVNKKYQAVLATSAGDITIQLNSDQTPITVNNFVTLSQKGFYNNTIFHRVINGFMIQGGDPEGDGTGGPGYQFNDEPFTGEYTRGTVAMANAGPNTNGSQFFIMHADNPLPKNYVIFGKVVSGMEVVDKIATAPVEISANGENSQPVSPIVIASVRISEQ